MLKIKDISCGYKNQFLLENISFSLTAEGNFTGTGITGIVGPNGSGKTTLLRAITKVLPLLKGEIFWQEKNIRDMDFKELAQSITVVSQDREIPADISVEEFVCLGRIPHQSKFQFFESPHDQKIVNSCLELTGTRAFKKRLIKTLSGGERQMVVMARALAQEPKMLLLDEPTVFLDISHQVAMLNLIRRLHHEKKINVLIVLHELNLASEYCDRIILLNKGQIENIGTPEQVFTKEIIERVYKTPVFVKKHPLSGRPYLVIVSEDNNEN
ncbi:MAG: ABC transporter ATP-binding protein [Candidatus Omnitrophota bacterium]